MKTIDISFFTVASCTITVEVPDEYEPSSDSPYRFWEDLVEKYPEQIETDIMYDEFDVGFYDGYEIEINRMWLDYIDSIEVFDKDGEVVLAKTFEKISYCDYLRGKK